MNRSPEALTVVLTVLLTIAFFSPAAAFAGGCGFNSPGFPVPECRDQSNGEEVSCSAPNAVRLWPSILRPGLPGQQLPSTRDSTQWESFTIPGAATGHELFHSLDIVGNDLYVVYNAGLQVWDIAGNRAEDPLRYLVKDGWQGAFAEFPHSGENDFFVFDVDVIDPPTVGLGNLIGVAAEDGVGTNFWEHDDQDLDQLYQDMERGGSRQIRLADLDGNIYAFAAGGGIEGVSVYNVTAAANLSNTPCVEPQMNCPGVYLGRLGTSTNAAFLDVLVNNGRIYVAVGRDIALPVEIWEVVNPGNPESAVRRLSGDPVGAQGVALFPRGGEFYLATAERRPGLIWEVHIYRATDCVTGSRTCAVQEIPWFYRPPQVGQDRFLTYSVSSGTPYLYYGVQSNNLSGTAIEGLFDLTNLGGSNLITEITERGGSYTDGCSGNTVDYWGDYYEENGFGMRNTRPRVGKFDGNYFYRAAFGMLDVHVITVAVPTLTITGPSAGCPGESATFQVTADNCSPDPPTSPYNWTATGGGQITGNGGTSVDITWTTPGNKTAIVTNADCVDAVGTAAITIQDTSALAFTSQPTYVGAPGPRGEGESVQFSVGTEGATEREWNWGDGSPAEVFNVETLGENPTYVFSQVGTYTVTVTIRNCAGYSETAQVSIEIIENPLEILQFRARCPFGICDFCIGDPVVFDQEFSGSPTTYRYDWDGDGDFDQTTSSVVTSRVYSSQMFGFRPRMQITAGAQSDEFTHVSALNVLDCTPPSITVSGPGSLGQNIPGNYSASASNCSPSANGWNWTASGGGQIAGNTNCSQVTISWNTSGTKTVTAQNNNCGGAIGTRTVNVTGAATISVFGPSTLETNETGGYSAVASGCTPAANGWTWTASGGGGIVGSNNTSQVSIVWSVPGTKTVSDRNTNCGSAVGNRTVTVLLPGEELEANFNFSPANPTAGQQVTFDGRGSTGNIGSWVWLFGDSSSANGPVATHTYLAGGSYPVSLTVTEVGCGNPACTDQTTQTVVVSGDEVLNASFSFSPQSSEAGQQVTFDGRGSTGNIESYDWTFGDGGFAIGPVVSHPTPPAAPSRRL